MYLKNAAKLHFLFQLTKYLSRNSRYQSIFFHFVNSAYQLLNNFAANLQRISDICKPLAKFNADIFTPLFG
jgi:hypothetical protein